MERFVVGTNKVPIRDRLFEEEASAITLDQLMVVVTSKEAFSTYNLNEFGIPKEPGLYVLW